VGVLVAATIGACGDDNENAGRPSAARDATSSSVASACAAKEVTITSLVNGIPAPPKNAAEAGALAAAIATSFCVPTWSVTYLDGTEQTSSLRPVLTAGEAACLRDGIVEGFGPARAREFALFGASPWSLLGFGLSNNSPPRAIDRAEAEQLVETFANCAPSWELLLILSVTQGADRISDASAAFVRNALSDADTRTMLVGEIDRAYDDPAQPNAQPFPELIRPRSTRTTPASRLRTGRPRLRLSPLLVAVHDGGHPDRHRAACRRSRQTRIADYQESFLGCLRRNRRGRCGAWVTRSLEWCHRRN
jgi:hypothetical protein